MIVNLLLDRSAEVSAQDERYGNTLQTDSHRGHEKFIKVLLDKGANVNAQGGEYSNALQAPSS